MTHIGDDHSIIRTAELIDQQFERRPIDFGIDPRTLEVRAELLGEKRLRIRLNLTEMVEAYDLMLTHLTATVNWGDTDGRYELDVPVNAEIEVDPTGWTERTRLVLEDSSTGLRFSSWVRGKEIYLS